MPAKELLSSSHEIQGKHVPHQLRVISDGVSDLGSDEQIYDAHAGYVLRSGFFPALELHSITGRLASQGAVMMTLSWSSILLRLMMFCRSAGEAESAWGLQSRHLAKSLIRELLLARIKMGFSDLQGPCA